jgi:hypothetical protein
VNMVKSGARRNEEERGEAATIKLPPRGPILGDGMRTSPNGKRLNRLRLKAMERYERGRGRGRL